MDTNFSERELELMQMRRDAIARASGQETQPAQQQAPVQQTNISSRTINSGPQVEIPGGNDRPSAADPNMQQMLQNVGDAVPGMLKNVAVPAAGAGILAGLAHLLLGGKADTTGDAKAGERREPLMDVSQRGRIDPTLAPEPQFAPGPVAPTQPVEPKPLSPLEQEDLRLKQLKNQRLELAIQHDKEKAERAKVEHEAKQAQQAAQAKQTGGGTMTESEMKMLAASENAKITKAIDANQKLQQAKNARVQAEGAVAPATVVAVENAKTTPAAVKPSQQATSLFETPGIADVIAGAKKPPVSHEKMPEGWGKGMTWLVNQHGVEGAKAYIDEFNNGKPFASHNQMKESYAQNTMRPKFSDVPKDIRKSREMVAPPQTSMRMLSTPMSGGGYRPGVDNLQHSLNPLKL